MREHRQIVSIVIVNWNGSIWLKRCIESLLEQTYQPLEIIVVDNNSSDNSISIIEHYYPRVILIKSHENLGFAGGNNLGIAHATGEWILLLNNDAWLDNFAILELLKEAKTRELDVIGAREVGYDDNKLVNSGAWTIDYFGHPCLLNKFGPEEHFYLSGVCLGFSKKLYLESGGLDSDFFMYFEETDWFWRLNAAVYKSALSNSITVHHATHGATRGDSRLSQKRFLWRNQNVLQMLLKNHRSINLIWVLPVYFGINLIEIFIFTLLGHFSIAATYPQGWWFNLAHLGRTLKKRREGAELRRSVLNPPESQMHKGFCKIVHLIRWLKIK